MNTYLVDGADLTSVANAIRTKGGTSVALVWPSGYVDAIGAISGGGSGSVETATVTITGNKFTAVDTYYTNGDMQVSSTGTWMNSKTVEAVVGTLLVLHLSVPPASYTVSGASLLVTAGGTSGGCAYIFEVTG